MEAILLISFIIIIVLFLKVQGNLSEQAAKTNQHLNKIIERIDALQNNSTLHTPVQDFLNVNNVSIAQKIAEEQALKEQIAKEAAIEKEANIQKAAIILEEAAPEPLENESFTNETTAAKKQDSFVTTFIKNNPDVEKFIGENLFNKIGIAVLVFGIAFFIKYAIDQNWINEYGRIAIGFLCGAILVGIAHYLRNTYRAFSSVLAGGSIAVFYFTIAFAFHQYHIIGQTAAFAFMIVITAFAVLLSILYNKIELSIIACIGGFITPFLVSNGNGNYVALFTYLVILNVGLLVLAYFKKWRIVNFLAFVFTIIIFGGWVIQLAINNTSIPVSNALVFATIFYASFLTMNLLYNVKNYLPFKAIEIVMILSCNAFYFTTGIAILKMGEMFEFAGLFTVLNAVINLLLAYYFFKTNKVEKNILYLLIGLTLSFISLAAPIQLNGNNITLFWAAEYVLLYWLYQQSTINIFKSSSSIVFGLMMISMLIDWSTSGTTVTNNLPQIFINIKGVVANVLVLISLAVHHHFLKKDSPATNYVMGIQTKYIISFTKAVFVILFYITGYFTINLYFANNTHISIANVYHCLFSYLFVVLFLWVCKKTIASIKYAFWIQTFLILFAFMFFLSSQFLIETFIKNSYLQVNGLLDKGTHWVSIFILIGILIYGSLLTKRYFTTSSKKQITLVCFYSFSIIFLLSKELQHVYTTCFANETNYYNYANQFNKAGLTILWGCSSFVMIWLGMKLQFKPLRIISIVLFAITLLKLFLIDIKNIGPAGKIAAFILLGIILLLVSFMYQRLKKILIDDTTS